MNADRRSFAHLADPPADHVTLEHWTFPDRTTLDAALDAVHRLTLDGPDAPASMSVLTSPYGPSAANVLRGTTGATSDTIEGRAALVHAAWNQYGPRDLDWSPTACHRRPGPSRFRRHDGYRHPDREAAAATLAVLVEIHFDGPDPDRLATWADLVVAALHGEPEPADGLLSAQFHLSDDHTQVANLALWTSEDDYDHALGTGPPGIAQHHTEKWQAAIDFPGITRNTATRYTDLAAARTADP